ncbi:glycosyltransferase [Pandoraea nosoerga]|uniref:Group 1 glycosyl transferase n=1 Tax=Pandoraea nosoerga TaxID=2508296 RepID=A0A5E4UVG4_9BURK|nr:glycosyltransferase family 4 protein [Pandoraea nosoerga]MBN4666580.1 glycosyltransferase [Pandoraea nosoerga]MBN4674176.1 glycosyltransferase [Pandoraea nosoerga]MBN4679890.1 glycosyltransferase [Pandoraea nosoerga]MBN4744395.1 glycosyltransferase [Pandoraea nosoerga]VVE02925.1 group 1 glycosyl transferase [Pandoraea nosoerga]
MNILQFYKTAYPDTFGGVEQVIHQIAIGCTRVGTRNNVLTIAPPGAPVGSDTVAGYTLYRARRNFEIASNTVSVSAIGDLHELAKSADIVHYHFPWPFMDVAHALARHRKPTVVTYHSDIVRQKALLQLYRPLQHWFLGSVDKIVATSPNYALTSPGLQRFKDKVAIIPFGLDESTYQPPDDATLARWLACLGPRFFLFVGVLRYYKGVEYLIEAARGTDCQIVIVGDGPLRPSLEASARGLANIKFLGALSESDKNALLRLCSGFVFPSHIRSEAFGISLLEAAMHGKPMISAEIGTGTTFINVAEQTGIVVPPANVNALRAALVRLWQAPAERERMGHAARERFLDLFTSNRMIGSYLDLYRSLLT